LDQVAPNHPVFIYSQDFHSCWVNSRALETAHIHAGTPDPPQGKIVRGDDGEPSGTLLELAANLVTDIIPKPSDKAMDEALEAAAQDLAGYGVTTVHTMGYEPQSYWQHIAKTASQDSYGLRVWSCIPHKHTEAALELGLSTSQCGSRFQVGGTKFFADGALGSLTAWMLEPYQNSNNYGIQVDDPEVLAERFPLVIEAGLTPVVHAIGDAANRAVLDALEATRPLWQAKGMRPRIEHAQHLHADDIPRFAQLGVIASVQPYHLVIDAPNARKTIPNRLAGTYAFGSLAKHGAHLALGSDTPVAVPGVLKAIRAAVTRIDADGLVFQENETLDVATTLRGYTKDAAYAIHAEHRSGQLKPGFDADVVVLSHNPLDGDLDALEVHGTMLAGMWTKVLE
ncbi:MAG: amidohydrolase, partial [Deinococcota bacterium]